MFEKRSQKPTADLQMLVDRQHILEMKLFVSPILVSHRLDGSGAGFAFAKTVKILQCRSNWESEAGIRRWK